MNIKSKTRDLILDLSLTDIIYGVVFAYGFNFFDLAKNTYNYFFLVLTYIILVVDWIYTHHTYWGKNYKKVYLILDLLVLFIFSRLLSTSISNISQFIYWLGGLFLCYGIWNFIMRNNKIENGFRWKIALTGDVVAGLLYIFIGILTGLKNHIS